MRFNSSESPAEVLNRSNGVPAERRKLQKIDECGFLPKAATFVLWRFLSGLAISPRVYGLNRCGQMAQVAIVSFFIKQNRLILAKDRLQTSRLLSVRPMKPPFILFALMVFVAGCIPLRQESQVSGPVDPSLLLCDDRYVLVGMDMKREKIVAEQSQIADPSGKRYTIQVEPHQFDIEQKFEALRADVYPCGSDGSRIRRWSNGVWSFHFVIESNGVDRVIDQRWKYWTFYYNPTIHGPPN